ncbi:hypothetical protein GLYMA_01G134800v4 [Glycine max]|uniref:Uncharacterized protein n=1 Tax=Glycine max TaxID=3847 RepID=K7K3N7_SOYBN|nr:hypothetical protein GLYMA_01G134800v4 [Glycine max]
MTMCLGSLTSDLSVFSVVPLCSNGFKLFAHSLSFSIFVLLSVGFVCVVNCYPLVVASTLLLYFIVKSKFLFLSLLYAASLFYALTLSLSLCCSKNIKSNLNVVTL